MNPRHRRLTADQQSVLTAFAGHPRIRVESLGPPPAERYRITYQVPALRRTEANELDRVELVVVDIALPAGYPREKPYCTTPTPIFHPNFGNYICIADFWSPSNTLVDVIVQIGDMLQYKLYNTSSPLNALAARWVADNLDRVPIGNFELIPVEPEIVLGVEFFAEADVSASSESYGQAPNPFGSTVTGEVTP